MRSPSHEDWQNARKRYLMVKAATHMALFYDQAQHTPMVGDCCPVLDKFENNYSLRVWATLQANLTEI
jgi:hypothetical protein